MLAPHIFRPPSPAIVRATLRDLKRIEKRYASSVSFSCASGVGEAGTFVAASGGLTTTPSWIAVGADGTGTTSAAPGYGTNSTGDLFVMQIYVRNLTVGLSAITGWTLQDGPDTLGNSSHYWLTRDTRSTGSEVGTVTATVTGNSIFAKIHTFRNVATSSFTESLSSGGSASNDTTVEAPTVTATSTHRLAVAAGGASDDAATASSTTGESGGDWTLKDSGTSLVGSDCSIWLQTAALDSGGAISGGTFTFGGGASENWAQHGFALIGI
jgi:hypothetical protein